MRGSGGIYLEKGKKKRGNVKEKRLLGSTPLGSNLRRQANDIVTFVPEANQISHSLCSKLGAFHKYIHDRTAIYDQGKTVLHTDRRGKSGTFSAFSYNQRIHTDFVSSSWFRISFSVPRPRKCS